MLQAFKKFLMRGNVVDLAVGLIMALSFSKIVTSFVNDFIMPPIGVLLGKVDFSSLYINLSGKEYESLAAAKAAGAATINYGAFVNTLIEFLIVGFVLFQVVQQMSRVTGTNAPLGNNEHDNEDAKDILKDRLKEISETGSKSGEPHGDSEAM